MKVIIIGKGQGWDKAPLEGETWGMTQLILKRPVKRVIDMNDYTLWGEDEAIEANWAREKAKELKIPYVDLGNYPLKSIIEYFGTDYFSNSVDYALALAINEGFKEIDLYGVNMATQDEYAYQKPGVEYWIGRAQGSGVKVRVFGNQSRIMRTHDDKLYGYGTKQEGL